MMTKKHFNAMATVIRLEVTEAEFEAESISRLHRVAKAFASLARADNERFDHRRFMHACRLEG